MAEKSLFFNALPDISQRTGYDRNYNANDISDWLSVVITTGVIKSRTGLECTTNGMQVEVKAGKAVILGKPYLNDSIKTFDIPTAPTGTTPRIDAIVIRYDNQTPVRDIHLIYLQGGADGSIPKITRNGLIYDLMLAYVTIQPNATSGTITNLIGDDASPVQLTDNTTDYGYCPYMVAVKGYDDYYDAIIERFKDFSEVETSTTSVQTGLSRNLYNPASDLASVYINGYLVDSDDYTLSNAGAQVIINFNYSIEAGQIVGLIVDRAYDGEGLTNVLADYLELKQQVENLTTDSEYSYNCNGVDDNVKLSEIASAFLSGGTTDRNVKLIKVYGNFGYTAPNSGDGSLASPYDIMDLGLATTTNRRITFDFTNCSEIMITTSGSGKYYNMFGGYNVDVIGGVFSISGGTNIVRMFASELGMIKAENCKFIVIGASQSYVSRIGTFTNCYTDVTNLSGTSYGFWITSMGMLRLIGGEHYSYGISGQINTVVYLPSGISCAYLSGASFPTVSRGGFIQTNYLYQASGGMATAVGVISALPNVVVSGVANIFGKIPMSKPNLG